MKINRRIFIWINKKKDDAALNPIKDHQLAYKIYEFSLSESQNLTRVKGDRSHEQNFVGYYAEKPNEDFDEWYKPNDRDNLLIEV